MSQENDKLALLEDARGRVIFYSCIAEPKNILEISRLWDYKTSTYFYQARSKKVIGNMASKELISIIPGSRYKSSYDFLLKKRIVNEYFERINNEISNEIIIERYDYEVTEGQLEDRLFKEFCIEKKPELRDILNETKIVDKEVGMFISLWETPTFRTAFLSADCIKKYVGGRSELPENPIDLLFSLTANACERLYHYKEGGSPSFENPFIRVWSEINEVFPLILTKLESSKSKSPNQFKAFARRFKNVYNIIRQKIAIYEGRSEISSYHIAKIADILGLTE